MRAFMKKAGKCSTFLLILLGLTLSFGGCIQETSEESPAPEAALEPTITVQPVSADYAIEAPASLQVAATVADNGILTYQWYSSTSSSTANGTAIEGKTDQEFALPTTEEGIYYYYAVVTNTNSAAKNPTASRASNVATIEVYHAESARYPKVTAQPGSVIGGSGTFTITATSPDGGTLSYQWYTNTENSSIGGTIISDATTNSYTVSGATVTTFYYVVVNNHNDTVSGSKDSAITSVPAAVLITNATVTVNTSAKFQYVRGFGGMYGSWDTGVGQDVSAQDIETMFNPDTGLGYNMLRMMVYPYHLGVDDEGLTWEDRIIGNQTYPNHDNSDWYDNIKTVNKYGGYVLASPWSPPKEWKTNDSINGGGTLRKEYYHDYALHLKNYSKLMSDRGAPIYAISIQNEPNFTASYDGCEWSNNDMRDFFIQEGHFTDGVPGYGGGRKIPAVLTMNGESANNTNINDPAIDNPMSNAAINLIGRHIYGNQQSRYAATKLNYSKEVWMTEHNVNSGTNTAYPNDSTWNYVWTFMNEVDLSIRLNDESAFIWWYAKRFYSMIGDGDFGTTDHAILPRGYGLSHYAKFAKETKRVDVTVTGKDASGGTVNVNNATYSPTSTVPKITAYESPDGNSISLVLFTPTSTAGVNGVNMGAVKIELPAGFIATSATAMRSTATIKAQTESVALSADGKSAAVSLPASTILSVKFTK